ncbi:Lid2 complex component lid2 [Golovinomyces cichoracearum]|uniref:Lid2 complex component lid2 n=1 Tax=Golovinomyces cichoracearum TaxID=62708 RepID=A0A420J8H6_9PEZI|nr:Lid2 complex component lid2 [Golovinomyces cichoracearum]
MALLSSNSSTRASPTSANINITTSSHRGKFPTNGTKNNPAIASLPLSAMQSAPLDLTSVERRGQPTASRERNKKFRPHQLQEAPTYMPTPEEFKNPFSYIKSIAPEASRFGICKIIPPDSWKPDFAIDTERFHFRTRKQELNSVEGSTRANLTYLDQLAKFHKQHGTNLNRFPSVDKRPLDLYKLKKAVEARGGFNKVCKLKKWAEIGRDLGYSGKIMSSLSTSLKNSYQRWLFPYEEYLRVMKPSVHQQLEYEYGGPLTPSPAPSPMKKSHQNTPSNLRPEEQIIQASESLTASMKKECENEQKNRMRCESPVLQSTSVTSGFTPVNAAPTTFTPVNIVRRDREECDGFTPPPRMPIDNPIASTKSTPDHRPSLLGNIALNTAVTTLPSPAPKRQCSLECLDSRDKNCLNEDRGRRSKRLRKNAVPTVAGSHMTMFRPTPPRIPGKQGSSTPGERCEQCGKSDDAAQIIICESCDVRYHMYCLDRQVTHKPDYDWHCPRCLVGDGQYGFEEGGIYSLKQFQEKAAEFKECYFQNKMPFDPVFNCPRPVTEDDIEREFWRLVTSLEETVEVEYGADIHSTTHGSGFPTMEKNPHDPYATDPWNLNIMPLHTDSLFRHIKSDISGMTVPWLYVGMIFSTFCWHNEDHYAYSANYQHFGSTKTWYAIPGGEAESFENAMREAVPELFETQPDLLFQLVTLLTPEQLKKAGINVFALDQRAGQFVITFPQAYHAGFNHGFNFNEAVNFAPSDWEPFGDAGVERLQQFRRQPCFSHDELLWTAAQGISIEGDNNGGVTIKTAKWLAPALERLRNREIVRRNNFMDKYKLLQNPCNSTEADQRVYPSCHIPIIVDEADLPEEEYQCFYCKAYCYLSRLKCHTSDKVLCLLHAGTYECCEAPEPVRHAGDKHTLHYRRTVDAIELMLQKISDKARVPELWEEKYLNALQEDAKPPLKILRALLSEGERIPYELKSLPELRIFVDRCNEWVEGAMIFTARKQQNRRKNERAWRKLSKNSLELEDRDRDCRKVETLMKLIEQSERLGFQCPEALQLNERAVAIKQFRLDASNAISHVVSRKTQDLENLLEIGKEFNIDMPEVEKLDKIVQQMKWNDRARDSRGLFLTLKDVSSLIEDAIKLEIPDYNDYLTHYKEQHANGVAWESKANEIVNTSVINYSQLEALLCQVKSNSTPVTAETLAKVNQILNAQREAHNKILLLLERSRDPDISARPTYIEARETIERFSDLNNKPNEILDLEKEQKRHEDWMRKGKKLFGKANAPLHILKSHLEYVLERNLDCFDIKSDKPRMPAEPASRDITPVDDENKLHSWENPRFREVFCICRRVEAGMMIECELCHEWYHGKCLKIARGKVKDDDKYTCPICDWRVKIPRDAARPKLEDLQLWQDEIATLPFRPDEEELLDRIIKNAFEFRLHVAPFCNPVMATAEECETQRFYLRKIEGAEILLASETNFFRQELHKWSPVASEPPPILQMSRSTRKPRPTKLQRLMVQHGVDDPDALPEGLWIKSHTKRKSSEPSLSRPALLQPTLARTGSGNTNQHLFTAGNTINPVLSNLSATHEYPHSHFNAFSGSQEPQFNIDSHSGMSPGLAPDAFLRSGLHSPGFGEMPRQPAPFNEAAFGRLDSVALTIQNESPVRDSFAASSQGVSRMFDELTNDIDDSIVKEEKSSPRLEKDRWEGDEEMEMFINEP